MSEFEKADFATLNDDMSLTWSLSSVHATSLPLLSLYNSVLKVSWSTTKSPLQGGVVIGNTSTDPDGSLARPHVAPGGNGFKTYRCPVTV